MPPAMVAEWLKVDGERLVEDLRETANMLNVANGQVVLDFSAVLRIRPNAIREMEALANTAANKAIKPAERYPVRGFATSYV